MTRINSLRKLQLEELKILKKLIGICNKNNIKYYILGGTFLGAVRHKGFIPWDDDIDIGMPRNDYEKFIELFSKYEKEDFKLEKVKHKYFIRVVNKNILVKLNMGMEAEITGAWIDIFPLDGMPSNFFKKRIHMFKILFWRAMFQFANFSVAVNIKNNKRPIYEKILIDVGRILKLEDILKNFDVEKRLDKCLKKYNYENSEFVGNFMGAYKFKEMFPKEIYDEINEYAFEEIKLIAPKDYDFVLKQLYGDYMKLPSVEERNKHQIEIL